MSLVTTQAEMPCLTAGASLHVPPERVKTDPIALRDWLLAERITTTFVPTPLCEAVVASIGPGRGRLLRAGAQETVGPTRKSVNINEHALQRTGAY
jgi:hypothetical protein